jgi:hypothetical protein
MGDVLLVALVVVALVAAETAAVFFAIGYAEWRVTYGCDCDDGVREYLRWYLRGE